MAELRKSYDVVVIGAGVGGGAMANRLARAGATRLPREADNWSVKAAFHERRYATRSVDWWITSEDLPDPNNRVSVDSDGKIRLAYTPNNLKSHNELVQHWTKLMRSLGFPIIITQKMDIKVAMHQCGTARFGNDPKTSVLDKNCKAWDVDNLYVVDASFLPPSTHP